MLRFKERVEKQLEAIRKENKELKDFFLLINQNLGTIMANLKRLEDAVAKATTINESAIALIKGISQQIKDAAGDETKLNALTDSLDASEGALAASVAANTPAAPVDPTKPTDPTAPVNPTDPTPAG